MLLSSSFALFTMFAVAFPIQTSTLRHLLFCHTCTEENAKQTGIIFSRAFDFSSIIFTFLIIEDRLIVFRVFIMGARPAPPATSQRLSTHEELARHERTRCFLYLAQSINQRFSTLCWKFKKKTVACEIWSWDFRYHGSDRLPGTLFYEDEVKSDLFSLWPRWLLEPEMTNSFITTDVGKSCAT